MPFLWNKDLETGNATIDDQHRQLVEAINNLLDACGTGRTRSELEKTLTLLCSHTSKHFSDEEKLQLQYKYPDYQNHKKMHEQCRIVVRDLTDQLRLNGPSINLVGKVNNSIGNWLINHIKTQDKKLAEHVRMVNENKE